MRWQPDSPVCAECGFDWQIARQDAIELVAQAPDDAATAITASKDSMRRTGDRWSASSWATAAAVAPADVQIRHPQFGLFGAVEVIRRDAHEVHHHLMDINRADALR